MVYSMNIRGREKEKKKQATEPCPLQRLRICLLQPIAKTIARFSYVVSFIYRLSTLRQFAWRKYLLSLSVTFKGYTFHFKMTTLSKFSKGNLVCFGTPCIAKLKVSNTDALASDPALVYIGWRFFAILVGDSWFWKSFPLDIHRVDWRRINVHRRSPGKKQNSLGKRSFFSRDARECIWC